MATTLPRPSRPSNGPPNTALPALPVNKTRKSIGNLHGSIPAAKSAPSTPRSGLRAPSANLPPPPSPAPTAALPQPKALAGANKSLRKCVSINSFPHPPRNESRNSSLPPTSPLANEKVRAAKRSKSSKESLHATYTSNTPSFLNGNGDGKAVSNARMSDGLTSASSPPQSRSSSAQDSYSTAATTYDDPGENSNQKAETAPDKRASKHDGKGNVVVSVRVRPDTNPDHKGPEGEWMVDGRKSLISFRGKEGGDHYYGMQCLDRASPFAPYSPGC